jgi:hypothetical protein
MKENVFFLVALLLAPGLTIRASASSPSSDSAFSHIQEQMDKYHRTFDVYTDMDAGGNHYTPSQWMQEQTGKTAISLTQECTVKVHSGITCIQTTYYADSAAWAAVGWVDSLGYNLTGAETCSFWAKGKQGGEQITFEVGGNPDDSIDCFLAVALDTSWQQYFILLSGGSLRRVYRGFCWAADRAHNLSGCTFYLDDIQFDQARLDSARLIQTYIPLFYHHDRDWALNQAYTYSCDLAMLAFLSRDSSDDQQRAMLIGDALKFCQDNDSGFTDGRLRNAYRAGDIRDHKTGKALLPGWTDLDSSNKWFEDRYQVGTYTGEMAWTILAWLTYDSVARDTRYQSNAVRLGNWIADSCYDATGPFPGYRGGFEGGEQAPKRLTWKATEHNLDLYAAFTRLYRATHDTVWRYRADTAWAFVASMWDSTRGCFYTGTKNSVTKDTLRVLDAQAWGLLVSEDTSRYGRALTCAEQRCRRDTLTYQGFCFSEKGDGICWEGTAQMCCAYWLAGSSAKLNTFLGNLKSWQREPQGNRRGIVSCLPDSSYTGQDRFWGRSYYFARLDIAATSWFIFADTGYNPFWNKLLPLVGVAGRNRMAPGAALLPLKPRPNLFISLATIPGHEHERFALYDVSGRKVGTFKGNRIGEGLSPGVYFLRLADGSSKPVRIVKIR